MLPLLYRGATVRSKAKLIDSNSLNAKCMVAPVSSSYAVECYRTSRARSHSALHARHNSARKLRKIHFYTGDDNRKVSREYGVLIPKFRNRRPRYVRN